MIDTRLSSKRQRRHGVVTPLNAYAEYLENDAWTWEHQALVRARLIVGDGPLRATFATIRNGLLCQARDLQTLKRDVLSMRHRMWEHRNREKS